MTTNTTPSSTAAPAQSLDQVEIFRPGRHVAMSGAVIEFSAADVAAIAAAYSPAVHEAPHVVGHPRTDGPAYGWVQSLGINAAGRLCVTGSKQIEPAFAEMVAAGRFKKRSASFYPPEHPANPTPGTYYLKHVGWLGAAAPAVKGLVDLGEATDGLVEFAGWDDEVNAGMWRRMREWFIGQFGAETADKVIPAWEVDALLREAMRPEPEPQVSNPPGLMAYTEGAPAVTTADPNSPAALAARAAELDARAARLGEQEAAQAALAKSARSAGIAAFADGLVAEGRLLPAERARIVAFMEALPDAARVVEFSEAAPTTPIETPALAVLQGFLKALPPRVDFAERAKPDGAVPLNVKDPQAIAKAAAEYQFAERQAGREVGMDVAVEHVVRQAAG